MVAPEGLKEGGPLRLHGAEVGLTCDLLLESRGTGGGGAAGAGKGAAPFEGVEVLALGEGEERLVAEGGGGGVVQECGD